LAELFRPPTDLLFVGTYDEAIERAKAMKQLWLVVNVQDVHEFDSQRLNRDTWSDAGVRASAAVVVRFHAAAVWHAGCTRVSSTLSGHYRDRRSLSASPSSILALASACCAGKVLFRHEEFTTRLSDTIDRLPLDSYRKVLNARERGAWCWW
jgi:hypothetical protein